MKIKLERKLINCPKQLKCGICHQTFEVGKLRTLLYGDRGLLIGDVCPHCLNQEAEAIQRLLKQQANRLMAHPQGKGAQTIASHRQALELLEIATENIEFPTFYHRLLKHMEIFAQEAQDLEAARFGLSGHVAEQRLHLEKAFKQDLE
ncbi:MAG TPA: hypothetical protein V6C57_06945 [Coleofasciculaceae cyanobacterium]